MARAGRAWQKRTIGPWLGRRWIIYRVLVENNGELIDRPVRGQVQRDEGTIVFRASDRDGELLTLFHELMHPSAPHLTRDTDVDNAAIALKSGLEAFGVDLSPMLRGYK